MIWVKAHHAQAQHWPMHAQTQPYLIGPRRGGVRGGRGALDTMAEGPLWTDEVKLSLSMHKPMLSLSMLVLDPNHPD